MLSVYLLPFLMRPVDFIQNLVFYIECAYIIPDYGKLCFGLS